MEQVLVGKNQLFVVTSPFFDSYTYTWLNPKLHVPQSCLSLILYFSKRWPLVQSPFSAGQIPKVLFSNRYFSAVSTTEIPKLDQHLQVLIRCPLLFQVFSQFFHHVPIIFSWFSIVFHGFAWFSMDFHGFSIIFPSFSPAFWGASQATSAELPRPHVPGPEPTPREHLQASGVASWRNAGDFLAIQPVFIGWFYDSFMIVDDGFMMVLW